MKIKFTHLQILAKRLKLISVILILFASFTITAQDQLDITFKEGPFPNSLEVVVRPNYNITFNAITSLQFTIRYTDPNAELTILPLMPMLTYPPLFDNGYYYQPSLMNGFYYASGWVAGSEYTVCYLQYDPAYACEYEMISDQFCSNNNIDYFVSVQGVNKTGEIYNPLMSFAPIAGFVDGTANILYGESTGVLTLTDYDGAVVTWQKSFEGGAWSDISGTAAATTYQETPTTAGTYYYRAEIQNGGCPAVYAEPAIINVATKKTIWVGSINDSWFLDGNWTNDMPDNETFAEVPVVDPNPYPLINNIAECDGLSIEPGAEVTIKYDGALSTYGNFVNDGLMTVQSTLQSDGSFIDNGVVAGSGSCKIERYLLEEKWHYLSSPITDAVSGIYFNVYLKSFDEITGTWTYIIPTDVALDQMKGYAAWAGDNLTGSYLAEYEGMPNTGYQSLPVSNTASATHTHKGYNMVGNPYPSAIDWNISSGWDRGDLDATIYLWNPVFGNYGTYTEGDPDGTNDVDNVIPAGQGFFIHVTDGNDLTSIGVNNDARFHGNKEFYKSTTDEMDYQNVKLQVSSQINAYKDELVVRFREDGTENYDGNCDAMKLEGVSDAPQMNTLSGDNVKLAVNTQAVLTGAHSEAIALKVGEAGIYTINVQSLENLTDEFDVFLEDVKDDEWANLAEVEEYSFFADPQDEFYRFILHFAPDSTLAINENTAGSLLLYQDAGRVCLKFKDNMPLNGVVTVIDPLGKVVFSERVNNTTLYTHAANNTGLLIVTYKADNSNHLITEKIIVQ